MAHPPNGPGTPFAGRPQTILGIAEAVRRSDSPIGMPVKVVAVDGHGGAGKTTLALELAELLEAEIIHTDDFASPDDPTHWWTRLIAQALEPIARGAHGISYERSNWGPDHAPEPVANQQVSSTMILEGVTASRREFRPYLAYAIWVEAPKDVCIARGVARDGEAMRDQWERWWREEEAYIRDHRPVEFADVVLGADQ